MCGTKAALVSFSLFLLVAAGFCIYQAHTVNKVVHHSKFKSQGPSQNEHKKYFLKGDENYHPIDETNAGCNCTRLYGGKRCKKFMWWDWVRTSDKKV